MGCVPGGSVVKTYTIPAATLDALALNSAYGEGSGPSIALDKAASILMCDVAAKFGLHVSAVQVTSVYVNDIDEPELCVKFGVLGSSLKLIVATEAVKPAKVGVIYK